MALDPTVLAHDILTDSSIISPIPAVAMPAFTNFINKISVHITEQIKRGTVDDVKVDTGTGDQGNISYVK